MQWAVVDYHARRMCTGVHSEYQLYNTVTSSEKTLIINYLNEYNYPFMKKVIATLFLCFALFFCHAQQAAGNVQQSGPERIAVASPYLKRLCETSEKLVNTDRARAVAASAKYLERAVKENNFFHAANAARLRSALERNGGNRQSLYHYDSLCAHYAERYGLPDSLFNALSRYGRDLLNANHTEQALPLLEKQVKLSDSVHKPSLQSRTSFNMGYYFFKKFRMTDARNQFKECLLKATEIKDDYLAATAKSWMANCSIYMGEIDSTTSYIYEALKYFQTNKKESDVGDCYATLAFAYQCNGNIDKAIEYYKTAREIFIREGDHLKNASQSLSLSAMLIRQKNYDTASYLVKEAEKIYIKMQYNGGLALVKIYSGMLYTAKGETEVAKGYFSGSDSINKKEKNDLLAIAGSGYSALNHYKEGDLRKADSLTKKALVKVNKILPQGLIKNAAARMNQYYPLTAEKERKEFQSTFGSTFLKSAEMDRLSMNPYTAAPPSLDSTIGFENSKQLLNLETQYKTRLIDDSLKIEKQNNLIAKKDISNKNITLMAIVSVSMLLGAGLWLQYRSRKRAELDKAKIELLQNEIHHRVKNNLGVIGRLVEVAGRNAVDVVPLSSLKNRIKSIELLHNHLYNGKVKLGNISLQLYFEDLCMAVAATYETATQIQIKINASAEIDSHIAEKLGLIMNELVTNCYKYAFEGMESGYIHISAQIKSGKALEIIVQDNGVGFEVEKIKTSYGMKLIRGLSNELNGRFSFNNIGGTRFTLELPA